MFLYHSRPLAKPKLGLSALFLFVLSSTAFAALPGVTLNENIKIDQFGYLNASKKVAIIANPQNPSMPNYPGTETNNYQVRRWADDVAVYSGTLTQWKNGLPATPLLHNQSGDQGWWFDFSSVTTPGSYYIHDVSKDKRSHKFEINDNVYNDVLKQAGRMYYYQRLNLAKTAAFAGTLYTDSAAYTQDSKATSSLSKGNQATVKDLSGGWMDAGDTNKYTTFAEPAVLQLLEAYRMNPAVFLDNWNIPESGNGVPDILDEVKWELDFLRKMQVATGTNGFMLKVGVDNWNDYTPLSTDVRPRYYVGECTSATLSGAAMFAAASTAYKNITVAPYVNYSNNLLTWAEAAWSRAKVTTKNFTSFETNCDSGDIKAGDADQDAIDQMGSAVKAAIYLYEISTDATKKAEYKAFVESNYLKMTPYMTSWGGSIPNGWWTPYRFTNEIALLRYSSLPGVTASVANKIRTDKQNDQNSLRAEYLKGTDLS